MRTQFCIYGEPRGKERPKFSTVCGHATARTPENTVLYENLVKTEYRIQSGVRFADDAMLSVRIFAFHSVPKSVSRKKHLAMIDRLIRPIRKPDWDNVGKIICDALNGIAYRDDAQIVDALVRKFYSDTPRVIVEISDIPYEQKRRKTMSDKTYVLSLSADTFNAFKMDFDSSLQRLLQKMDKLQSDSASINCKISVALTPAPERNFDAAREGDTVQVMKPSFSHEISTEIKVKDKTTGNLSGNRKLVWDEELMEYVMKDIDDGQTSLFDTAQSRQNAASPVEQEPPQLPEGIVDVDYTVISDDKGYILRNPDKCGIKDQWGILKVLVGERMTVSRSAGHCYAETADGIIALGSAYLAEDPRHVDDSILEPHLADEIACNGFGTVQVGDHEEPEKIVVECLECGGILLDVENPNVQKGDAE